MVRYFKSYIGNRYQIFVVSRSKELTAALLTEKINVGEMDESSITFYPEKLRINLTPKEVEDAGILAEQDVCEISSNGILYRWYSSQFGDAGIATTARCNSNCIMCPASDKERHPDYDISVERLKRVIRYMPKDLWYFTITGGEPTLVGEDNFIDIYNTVKYHLPNTKILLLTNGRTLGNRHFFDRFCNCSTKNLRIAIPIHGSTAELHEYITQGPGGFRQTMRGIINVLNAGIELELRIVVSKLNCNDLMNIARLIAAHFSSVRIVHFIGLEMRGNCVRNAEQVILPYEEAFQHSAPAIRYLMTHGIDVALYNFPYCMIDKNFWPIAKKSISAYKSEFYEECEQCSMQKLCCGIFTATRNYYKPKVYPLIEDSGDVKLL